jgi:hypothetical protein
MRRKSTREEILAKIVFHQKNKKEAQKEYKMIKKRVIASSDELREIKQKKNRARVGIQNYRVKLRKLDNE